MNVPLCIEFLLEQLRSENGADRKKARETLGRMGKSASPFLSELLHHPNERVRWEACKTLERIRDPRTAPDLSEALMDDDMDVRWVAADALIELEHHAIMPVLEMIRVHFNSVVLREAAHHVLHSLKASCLLDDKVEMVLQALHVSEMPSKAAFAAIHALDHLKSAGRMEQHRWLLS